MPQVSDQEASGRTVVRESSESEFHCPACSFGPRPATDVLLHIVTNHDVQ